MTGTSKWDLLANILTRTVQDGECLMWTGAKAGTRNHKYAYIWLDGKPRRAHRVVYYLLTGSQPEAVLHTCDRPACLSPLHLWGGTQHDNIEDAIAKGRMTGRPRKKVAS